MLLGDSEVGAAGARALGTQHRIGAAVAAKAGRTLTSIDAISPVAHAEPHIGLTQNEVDVFLHIVVAGTPAKAAARRYGTALRFSSGAPSAPYSAVRRPFARFRNGCSVRVPLSAARGAPGLELLSGHALPALQARRPA